MAFLQATRLSSRLDSSLLFWRPPLSLWSVLEGPNLQMIPGSDLPSSLSVEQQWSNSIKCEASAPSAKESTSARLCHSLTPNQDNQALSHPVTSQSGTVFTAFQPQSFPDCFVVYAWLSSLSILAFCLVLSFPAPCLVFVCLILAWMDLLSLWTFTFWTISCCDLYSAVCESPNHFWKVFRGQRSSYLVQLDSCVLHLGPISISVTKI